MRRGGLLVPVLAVAAALFALLWWAVAAGDATLLRLDDAAIDAAARFGADRPWWITGWDVFCTVLGPTAFRLFGLVALVFAIRQRNPRAAAFLSVTIGLAGLLTQVVKEIADRPRPVQAFVDAHSSSFPSGHAVGVMVGVVALLAVAPSVHRAALVAGAAAVVAIGLGRVVLCVHHPSDVLAGWALGLVWVLAWWLVLRPTRLRPTVRSESAPAGGGGGLSPRPKTARRRR